MGIKSFEEAEVWKDARVLTKSVRLICKREYVMKDFGWVDQISRASLSIMANIAEGFEAQTDKEFAVFLGYAKRSAGEVRSHLFYGKDEEYLTDKEFSELGILSKKICAGLANFIRYLHNSNYKARTSLQIATRDQ